MSKKLGQVLRMMPVDLASLCAIRESNPEPTDSGSAGADAFREACQYDYGFAALPGGVAGGASGVGEGRRFDRDSEW